VFGSGPAIDAEHSGETRKGHHAVENLLGGAWAAADPWRPRSRCSDPGEQLLARVVELAKDEVVRGSDADLLT
jgi:hypothetical protein